MVLGEKESRRFRSIAVNQIAGCTTVAMEDPSDVYAIDEMAMRLDSRILPVYAEASKISYALDHVFRRGRAQPAAAPTWPRPPCPRHMRRSACQPSRRTRR